MKTRRLNEAGIQKMVEFLDSLTIPAPQPVPVDTLTDARFSEPFEPELEIESRSFETRFEAAEYLSGAFERAGVTNVERDRALWAWLGLFYFESLCPKDGEGRYRPGALARWIPEVENYQRYYRHLLAGPYRIYRAHRDDPDRALALLCTAPSTMGDIVEQIASRQELVTNNAVVGAATDLYVNPASRRQKRGGGGKGPGSPRRFADVLNQLDLTFDLYAMTRNELLALLPREFDRFRPPAVA